MANVTLEATKRTQWGKIKIPISLPISLTRSQYQSNIKIAFP